MSNQERNQKGRWIDEGKESGTIRLDKDVVDLGREEIQTRVRQDTKNEDLWEAIDHLDTAIAYIFQLLKQDWKETGDEMKIIQESRDHIQELIAANTD